MLGLTKEDAALLLPVAQEAALADTLELWTDAAWIPVRLDPKAVLPKGKLVFDEAKYAYVLHRRAVLYDQATGLPLLFFHFAGAPEVGSRLRAHGEVLSDARFKFDLHRGGALGDVKHGGDAKGEQRMYMARRRTPLEDGLALTSHRSPHSCQTGARSCHMNKDPAKRPSVPRHGLRSHVLNNDDKADLDLYASGYDRTDYWHGAAANALFQAMEDDIVKRLPRLAPFQSALMMSVDVERRAHTDVGLFDTPLRLLPYSGLSSGYHTASHEDASDVGFTTAYAGKDGHTPRCPCFDQHPEGCAGLLFDPKWRREKWAAGEVGARA